MDKPDLSNVYGKEGEDQIILTSGRLLFNAKSDFLMGVADKGISFSTNGGFHINGGDLTHINTEKIYLGLDAENKGQPVLMGDDTHELLMDTFNLLEGLINDFSTIIGALKWPAGGGPAVTPATLLKYLTQINTDLKLRDIKSNAVFTIKKK